MNSRDVGRNYSVPIPVTSDVSLEPFRESVEIQKTGEKTEYNLHTLQYLLLRCYYMTCLFFIAAKTCTTKQIHELGSPVELS